MLGLLITGRNCLDMILNNQLMDSGKLITYGYSLRVVYLVWIAIVLFLYPFCKWYMEYKASHRDKWWLSYL
jgi:hypothetical protein